MIDWWTIINDHWFLMLINDCWFDWWEVIDKWGHFRHLGFLGPMVTLLGCREVESENWFHNKIPASILLSRRQPVCPILTFSSPLILKGFSDQIACAESRTRKTDFNFTLWKPKNEDRTPSDNPLRVIFWFCSKIMIFLPHQSHLSTSATFFTLTFFSFVKWSGISRN